MAVVAGSWVIGMPPLFVVLIGDRLFCLGVPSGDVPNETAQRQGDERTDQQENLEIGHLPTFHFRPLGPLPTGDLMAGKTGWLSAGATAFSNTDALGRTTRPDL